MLFLLPNRKTRLVENTKLAVKVFSVVHVYGHELSTIPVAGVLLYFPQEQRFSVRARQPFLQPFLFLHFIFIFYTTNNKALILNSSLCPD
jgi:hypothetical protein